MSTSHTPGPWAISKLATPSYAPEFGIYAEGSERDLARIIGDNSTANATLIAAAPDLLDALYNALPYVEDILADKAQLACFKPGVVQQHAAAIRAAIAKAENK